MVPFFNLTQITRITQIYLYNPAAYSLRFTGSKFSYSSLVKSL